MSTPLGTSEADADGRPRLRFYRSTVVILAAAAAHLVLWWQPTPVVAAAAVYLITLWLPGYLLATLLVGQSEAPPTLAEYVLLAMAAGYGLAAFVMLLISYVPGAPAPWAVLLTFDGLLLILVAAVNLRRRAPRTAGPADSVFPDAAPVRSWPPLLWAGLLAIVLVGGALRLTNLGYAEFHSDEATIAMRAAGVLQGYESTLFLHRKGPTEILIPALPLLLTGGITELAARLPFAVAGILTLLATFLLGWRLFHPLVGFAAALLLALDGYFIGFSRIVQYQSIVLLTGLLVVLIGHRLIEDPRSVTRYLVLAAGLWATGLASHWDAAALAPAIVYLFGLLLWRHRAQRASVLRGAAVALLLLVGLLALSYVPFVSHPHFRATLYYLTAERVGGAFPYNNVADFFLRSTVYTTTYQVLLMIALLWLAYALSTVRSLGWRWGTALGLVAASVIGLTFADPTWLTIGGRDLLIVPVAGLLLAVILLPRLPYQVRMLWIWFGAVSIGMFFLMEKPRSHVYTFFVPWALLSGWSVAEGCRLLQGRVRSRVLAAAGVALTVLMVALFGNYAYWYFVYNRTEVLRTWDAWHPPGYWTVYDEPDSRALFGFPIANGWKAVAMLYEHGVLHGAYETNENESWIPDWYTQGQRLCARDAEWYFEAETLERMSEGDRIDMASFLSRGFERWGVVEVNGAPRLVIYRRTTDDVEPPQEAADDRLLHFDLADFAPEFDRQVGYRFPLSYPAVEPSLDKPLAIDYGGRIWLEGYDVDLPGSLTPGSTIDLQLYWRAQQPLAESYKIFIQAYGPDGRMVAQGDGLPVCDRHPTSKWAPGELITDHWSIAIAPDAPAGVYPLVAGLYDGATGERLPVLDATGAPVDDKVQVAELVIAGAGE